VQHHEPGVYGQHGAFTRAYLAVDFFYMLSGLVLAMTYEAKLRAGLGAGRFMAMRVARLWPIIALGVVLGAVGQVLAHGPHGVALPLAMGLALVPRLWGMPGRIYWLDGPQWSVVYELVGNWLHASVLWRLSNRALLWVVLGFGVVLAWLCVHFGVVAMGDTVASWWAGFFRLGFAYGLGVWIGRRLMAKGPSPRRASWVDLALPPVLFSGVLFGGGFAPLAEPWLDMTVVFGLFPPLLWRMARADIPARIEPLARWLGGISYPLYAVHVPILVLGAWVARGTAPGLHMALRWGAVVACVVVAAVVARSPLARGIPLPGWLRASPERART